MPRSQLTSFKSADMMKIVLLRSFGELRARRTRGVNPYTLLWVRKLRVFGVQCCACVNDVAKEHGEPLDNVKLVTIAF